MLAVSAPLIAVMDADLQHDTSKLRDIVDEIRNGADLAVGTRVAAGGSYGTMDRGRLHISQLSNKIAKRLLSVELSDPMSGFFMMRLSLFMIVVRELAGLGFKILLDITASMPRKSVVVEVPYQFRNRLYGESKLDTRAALDYVLLIIDKTVGRFLPTRFVAFCVVGSVGAILHFLVLGTAGFEPIQLCACQFSAPFFASLSWSLADRVRRLEPPLFTRNLGFLLFAECRISG